MRLERALVAVWMTLSAVTAANADAQQPGSPIADFTPQAVAIYRVAACGAGPLPAGFPARVVDAHCAALRQQMAGLRRRWIDVAGPFLAGLRPAGTPDRVVYPFGGGDLLSALTTFPDATEITTISLELSGDPRAIDRLSGGALRGNLTVNRQKIGRLFFAAHSTTQSLRIVGGSALPGELVFSLVALAVHGYQPVSLRYFRLQPDGSLHYLTTDDVAAHDAELAAAAAAGHPLKEKWHDYRGKRWQPETTAFTNMEIGYRRVGAPAGEAPRVFRHIAFNLDNDHLSADPSLLRHLEAKGRVAAMTKAASFLLWMDDFSLIRTYLLDHMDFMVSDATGVPPEYADAAGFRQDTYGQFSGPYFYRGVDARFVREFTRLWRKNPKHTLAFRYGYPDSARKSHLLVTRRR